MGKAQRDRFRDELQALVDNGKREMAAGIDHETEEFYELNRRTWEAEKQCRFFERLWVRGQVD